MRDPRRIDRILDKIRDRWEKSPDMRLCQLLTVITAKANSHNHPDMFYLEDDLLEEVLDS